MKTSDFYYDLPKELIAQDPLEDRSSSRLLVLHRKSGRVEHRVFTDIVEYLKPGDCPYSFRFRYRKCNCKIYSKISGRRKNY